MEQNRSKLNLVSERRRNRNGSLQFGQLPLTFVGHKATARLLFCYSQSSRQLDSHCCCCCCCCYCCTCENRHCCELQHTKPTALSRIPQLASSNKHKRH